MFSENYRTPGDSPRVLLCLAISKIYPVNYFMFPILPLAPTLLTWNHRLRNKKCGRTGLIRNTEQPSGNGSGKTMLYILCIENRIISRSGTGNDSIVFWISGVSDRVV